MEGSGDFAEDIMLQTQEMPTNFTEDEPLLTGDTTTNEILTDISTTGGTFRLFKTHMFKSETVLSVSTDFFGTGSIYHWEI